MSYIAKHWKHFIIPITGPVLVCLMSYLTTNIGWIALPLSAILALFCGGVQMAVMKRQGYD